MSSPALTLDRDEGGRARLRLSGDWTLGRLDEAQRALAGLPRDLPVACVDTSAVGALDSAGALLWLERLVPAAEGDRLGSLVGLRAEWASLLRLVADQSSAGERSPRAEGGLHALLARIG